MKRNIILILVCFLCTFAYSQKQYQNQSAEQSKYGYKSEKPTEIVYAKWRSQLPGYWGSFYWKVMKRKVDKNYYYSVYVWSGSYFNEVDNYGNYRKAITKITDCKVWAQDYEETVQFDVGTVVFDWKKTFLFEFYTDDAQPRIKILYHRYQYEDGYKSVSAYDYSKIR